MQPYKEVFMKQRFLHMILLGIKQFRDPYYQGFAAQISFYLLLSIVPIFLLLTQILGYFDLSLETLMDWIEDYTGSEVTGMLNSVFEFSSVGAGNIIFVVVALWSASRAQFAIMRITNYTYAVSKAEAGSIKDYWIERFRAVWTMGIILITLVFAILILAYGELVLNWLLNLFHLSGDLLWKLFSYFRWLPGLALYFLMVIYIYYIMPSERIEFRKILPGSLFASVGMLLVTWIYAKYINTFANYDIIYGTLSSIVAILFWFYFLAWVLCLGILVNKAWSDTSSFSKRNKVERPWQH